MLRQINGNYMENQGKRYDLIATGFANMRVDFATEQKYVDLFMKYLPAKASILDVGCGSGIPIAAYLIQHRFKVTGIDGSNELLTIARKNCPSMKFILGDIRHTPITDKFDGIIEWWCLFHLPKTDQLQMIAQFGDWLKPHGILEFTSGDREHEESSSAMLNQELHFYSCDPHLYENALKKAGFKLLLRESDQEQHLVWIAKKIE